MNKKYKLTDITMEYYGVTLHRIKALINFSDVKKGDLGGWIEKECNLSQKGNCWVYDDAKVYENAMVYDDAKVYENAMVYGNAMVYENAMVYGNAEVYGDSEISKILIGKMVSKVDDYVEIQNPEGRIVTGVLKDGKVLYNIGCQDEITKEKFIHRIENENGGLKYNPHRKAYYKIIDMIELYFKDQIKTIDK